MKTLMPDNSIKAKENSKIMQLVELTELSDEELELVVGGTETLIIKVSIAILSESNTGETSLAWSSTGSGGSGGSGGSSGSGGSDGW
ncbi:hypothetical protein NIES37_34860 [Tolypothrix tenuis PCC 7101]|uniref:Uncharacterized protein n=2 Tax=Tolypothrix TaxID=111782 RepID=A0A1Z4N1B2_9CYAN|nr:hypothetical protein [Aulosira sp. FACHB-113]BAY99503.1 hypothetical protein NIES37_34860 [Tolypothrix tenuis PCC 7101]BAZ76575.1 hypothetical protein NIES50_51730 [Aulosira laxa NIES-50]